MKNECFIKKSQNEKTSTIKNYTNIIVFKKYDTYLYFFSDDLNTSQDIFKKRLIITLKEYPCIYVPKSYNVIQYFDSDHEWSNKLYR